MVRALVVIVMCAGAAHADKLDDAKKALDAVRYDDAQKLLLAGLDAGGNSPAALAEIYKLAASTAIVLGQRDVAEQYYRRWIAVDPHAALPQTLAPKLREPFVAAQSYMAAHGQLVVRLSRRSATDVDVAVESDPLAMAAAVAIAPGAPVRLGVDHRAHLVAPAGARDVVVLVLDETGNHLRELPAGEASPEQQQPPPTPEKPHPPAKTPLYREWLAYTLPGAAAFVVGLGFATAASSADGQVQNVIATHGFYGDALAAQQRRDRDATIADGFFLGAAALGAAAVIVYVTRPQPEATIVTPTVAPGALGVTVSRAW
jgi:hypothetical protein